MARRVLAYFPDTESAQRALDLLHDAGLDAKPISAIDPDLADMAKIVSDKLTTTIAVVHPEAGEAEARSLMMRAGAIRLQGHGTESDPTGMTPLIAEEPPVPVVNGERVVTD